MERIKDYLLMEEEYIKNQERMKPQDEKNEEERSQGWSLFYTELAKCWPFWCLKRT